jgi:hypothetical protein
MRPPNALIAVLLLLEAALNVLLLISAVLVSVEAAGANVCVRGWRLQC